MTEPTDQPGATPAGDVPADGPAPDQDVPDQYVPDHATTDPADVPAGAAAAPEPIAEPLSPSGAPSPHRTRATLVTVLAGACVLLLGVVIGLLVGGRGGATSATPTTPSAGGASPTASATAIAPSPTPSPTPTLTEEQQQQILDLIRAQPRREEGDPYAIGAVDAPVVLIEYADYRCHFCGQWTLETRPELMALVDDGTLRIEWRDFPIFGDESIDLAVAARAAAQQGLFWEYNEALFSYQFADGGTDLSQANQIALAEQVGVPDIAQFTADLASPDLRAEVEAEYQASLTLLARPSTPQFLVNDQHIAGAAPIDEFRQVIDEELAKAEG